jgi:aspartate aminotransferase-like enzyme
MKQRLFTPGPTPIHEAVARSMAAAMPHHRTEEFIECMQRTQQLLRRVYRTEDPIVLLSSSGTGAMEAAVVNLTRPGETVVHASGGKFTERWGELLRVFGRDVREIPMNWGEPVTPESVHDTVRKTHATAVFVTHSETSTGALCDLQQIARVARDLGALVVVDAITSLGAHRLETAQWKLDCVVGGSQKAFMMPPGLAFLSLGRKAQERLRDNPTPRYYFDLRPALDGVPTGQTPWTPAISLVQGLEAACRVLVDEGLEQVWLRHQDHADAVRAGVEALGLRTVSQRPSNAVTAVWIPEDLSADGLRQWMWETFQIKIAGGQGPLRGRIVRLGHLGAIDEADILLLMTAFERALIQQGFRPPRSVVDVVAERLQRRSPARSTP